MSQTGGPSSTPAAAVVAVRHKGLLTAAIMLATIMQVLDASIINVALPAMRGSLRASQDQIMWVLTSYVIAAAIMTPVTGWLSDRFGIKQVLLTAIAGFVGASMACGLATGLDEMVLFRLLQGMFGASLVPLSQTLLLDINPNEQQGKAMAVWAMGVYIGPIIGPTLGGWIAQSFNWRYVFFINLPVGILALAGVMLFLPRLPERPRRFDVFGFAMLALAIGALQLMLDRGQGLGWFSSTEVWIEAGLAASGLWVFAFHIMRAERPFLDPAVLKDINLTSALIFIFAVGAIVLSASALLPSMLQEVLGYPVGLTGLVLAPRGVGAMMAMMIVGRLVNRIDVRLLILFGLATTAFSLHLMTGYAIAMGETPVVIAGVLQGFGMGFVSLPLTMLAYATLEARFRADAAGLFNLMRNVGASMGISIASTVLSWNIAASRTDITDGIREAVPQVAQLFKSSGLAHTTLLALLNSEISLQATMVAYIDDFKLMMLVTVALMPLLLFMRKPKAAKAAGRRTGGGSAGGRR